MSAYDTLPITNIDANDVSDEIDVPGYSDKWVAVSGLTGGTATVQCDDTRNQGGF